MQGDAAKRVLLQILCFSTVFHSKQSLQVTATVLSYLVALHTIIWYLLVVPGTMIRSTQAV